MRNSAENTENRWMCQCIYLIWAQHSMATATIATATATPATMFVVTVAANKAWNFFYYKSHFATLDPKQNDKTSQIIMKICGRPVGGRQPRSLSHCVPAAIPG